ncbi:hypothetical protein K8B33_05180 [Alcanivorax sp. JB21]|uniref:hypothetical protein n=1 Tax=Alcanivorax limicola TaxID=2874102 RepID=UPI001CBAE79C|nr:hypothetical protein [Alcanivorax limicola]MBZ2188477.1 hypothetical protein [Alcanivorax limicola]
MNNLLRSRFISGAWPNGLAALATLFAALALTACGGGGSSSGGNPPPDGTLNWTPAALISASVNSQRDATAVIGPDATTFFWVQNNGGENEIFARRVSLDSDTPVDSTEKVSGSANAASNPSAVVDSLGNVTVTWRDVHNSELSIYANRFDAGTGVWLGPVVLEGLSGSASAPLIAINDAGQIAVAFSIDERSLHFVSYNAGNNTWSTPLQLISVAATRTLTPADLAHAGNNTWLLAYGDATQSPLNSSIQLARINAATTPATSSIIDIAPGTASTLLNTLPSLAVLANGDAAVAYNSYALNTLTTTLKARVRLNNGTLSSIVPLEDNHLGPLPNVRTRLVTTPDSQFNAIWYRINFNDLDAREGLVLRRFTAAASPSLAAPTFAYNAERAASSVDFDAITQNSRVYVVWQEIEDAQPDNELNLWSSYFLDGSGWNAPERVERDARVSSEPALVKRGNSNLLVTWLGGPGGASSVLFAERCPGGSATVCD